jgi:hypothetical protein
MALYWHELLFTSPTRTTSLSGSDRHAPCPHAYTCAGRCSKKRGSKSCPMKSTAESPLWKRANLCEGQDGRDRQRADRRRAATSASAPIPRISGLAGSGTSALPPARVVKSSITYQPLSRVMLSTDTLLKAASTQL